MYSYSPLNLILRCKCSLLCKSLFILDSDPLLAANTLTLGLSQWFRKDIFYRNKKPDGIAGTDQKPSASWQIAFYVKLACGSLGGRNLHIKTMKAMPGHKTVIPSERNKISLGRKVQNYNEWMTQILWDSIWQSKFIFLGHSLIYSFLSQMSMDMLGK